jgi:NADP-dependent 3-hydroxy acid dehydrogenase YdfG
MFAHADDVARAVVYAVTQPIALNIFEMVVRPQRSLPETVTRPHTA